ARSFPEAASSPRACGASAGAVAHATSAMTRETASHVLANMAAILVSGDDDRPRHAFVPVAAEDVAEEGEGPFLVRREANARHLARDDVGAELELGRVEAHDDLGRAELEHDRLAFPELDHVRQ